MTQKTGNFGKDPKGSLWQHRLEKMRAVAEARGGECLTTEYIDYRSKFTWRCAEGHVWQARSDGILAGDWCPTCNRLEKNKRALTELQEIAAKRGGKCLATEYVRISQKLPWQCAQGHIWETTSHRIKLGHWCPACVHDELRLGIDIMHKIAEERGGLCLSEKYVNCNVKLRWQCRYGHVWDASPGHIRSGRWCPVCARFGHTIEDMQQLARERGGACLSKEYHGIVHKMTWKCKLGHVWDTTPFTVLGGSWCPECYYLSMCVHDEARKKYLVASNTICR